MKVAILLIFIFISFLSQATELPALESAEYNNEHIETIHHELKNYKSQKRFRIEDILKRSVFNTKPESLAEGRITNYDPMLISIVAAMKSHDYERNNKEWIDAVLPPIDSEVSAVCPKNLRVHVKNTNSPYTFVILPGTYANWKAGAFLNQTALTLKEQFNDPNILYIPGYLSEEFLTGSCTKIPWDLISIADDLYLRIRRFLQKRNADPKKTGLIGWSGGGALSLVMLALDSYSPEPVLQNGGMAFSPVLDGRTTFSNLDTGHNLSLKKTSHTLASLDWRNLKFFMHSSIKDGSIDWKDIVNMYEKDPEDFIARAFNHLTSKNLKDTIKSINLREEHINGKLSHYNFHVNTGFRQTMQADFKNNDELNLYFDEYLNIQPYLEQIKQPFFIHFSQDDPILSSHDNSGQPQVITDVLNAARQNPNIIVSNPVYGAHTAQGLDPIFDELIKTFFAD